METLYKIRGQARRDKRKELSHLKSFVRGFWYFEDIDRVYGGGLSDEECEFLLRRKGAEIERLENELKMKENGDL